MASVGFCFNKCVGKIFFLTEAVWRTKNVVNIDGLTTSNQILLPQGYSDSLGFRISIRKPLSRVWTRSDQNLKVDQIFVGEIFKSQHCSIRAANKDSLALSFRMPPQIIMRRLNEAQQIFLNLSDHHPIWRTFYVVDQVRLSRLKPRVLIY